MMWQVFSNRSGLVNTVLVIPLTRRSENIMIITDDAVGMYFPHPLNFGLADRGRKAITMQDRTPLETVQSVRRVKGE
jgi:hypothetical protein